jgi:hypothetical protein
VSRNKVCGTLASSGEQLMKVRLFIYDSIFLNWSIMADLAIQFFAPFAVANPNFDEVRC